MNTLLGLDWREAWFEHNRARKAPDDPQFWDGRAKEFSQYVGRSSYTDTLIGYLALEKEQRILDMGSGSGTLAIPLARLGHEVLAADFSPVMLGTLNRSVEQEGLSNVRTVLLDFNAPWDEWEAAGITENSVDVVLASRSTMVDDLWEAFSKLERAARTKVAITAATEYGPRKTKLMREGADGQPPYVPDFIFAVNLLLQMGRYPQLRYIDSIKPDKQGTPRLIRWAYISWLPPLSQKR